MRDGVKLHTVIVVPKGAKGAPILLTRTPYDADGRAARNKSGSMLAILSQGDELFVQAGYIRVFQDIRGQHGSEGGYVMTRAAAWGRSIRRRSITPPTPGTRSTGW
jgi:predicted acyl esterase